MLSWLTGRQSTTGFTPNLVFGREVSELVDLVEGLPPDPDTAPSASEYVQHLWERLELVHQIARDALGESVKRARTAVAHSTRLVMLCGTSSKVHRKSRARSESSYHHMKEHTSSWDNWTIWYIASRKVERSR